VVVSGDYEDREGVLSLGPDRRLLVARQRKLIVVDAHGNRTMLFDLDRRDQVEKVVWSRNGHWLAMDLDSRLVVASSDGKLIREQELVFGQSVFDVNNGGNALFSGYGREGLQLLDASPELIPTQAETIADATFSDDGKAIYAIDYDDALEVCVKNNARYAKYAGWSCEKSIDFTPFDPPNYRHGAAIEAGPEGLVAVSLQENDIWELRLAGYGQAQQPPSLVLENPFGFGRSSSGTIFRHTKNVDSPTGVETLSGTVDIDSQPVAGATVRARPQKWLEDSTYRGLATGLWGETGGDVPRFDEEPPHLGWRYTLSNDEGYFQFDDLPSGFLWLVKLSTPPARARLANGNQQTRPKST
jgi:hypothetical protein